MQATENVELAAFDFLYEDIFLHSVTENLLHFWVGISTANNALECWARHQERDYFQCFAIGIGWIQSLTCRESLHRLQQPCSILTVNPPFLHLVLPKNSCVMSKSLY